MRIYVYSVSVHSFVSVTNVSSCSGISVAGFLVGVGLSICPGNSKARALLMGLGFCSAPDMRW